MQKGIFYRCLRTKRGLSAVKTEGYIHGSIGLNFESYWFATHIPTGTALLLKNEKSKSKEEALEKAQKRIAETPDFEEKTAKWLASERHQKFIDSFCNQAFTT
jgi:hypothetical protein